MPSGVLAFRLSMGAILFFALCVLFISVTEKLAPAFRADSLVDRVVPGDRNATIKAFVDFERMSAQRNRYELYFLGLIMIGSAIAGLSGSFIWWPLPTSGSTARTSPHERG